MNIYDYRGKYVRITDIDGQIFSGHAAYYTSALDDPDGIESLSIEPDGKDDVLISFTTEEISSIEIVSDETHFAQAV